MRNFLIVRKEGYICIEAKNIYMAICKYYVHNNGSDSIIEEALQSMEGSEKTIALYNKLDPYDENHIDYVFHEDDALFMDDIYNGFVLCDFPYIDNVPSFPSGDLRI